MKVEKDNINVSVGIRPTSSRQQESVNFRDEIPNLDDSRKNSVPLDFIFKVSLIAAYSSIVRKTCKISIIYFP